jgi:alpha-L-fucosidase
MIGAKYIMLTTKHSGGFCIWQTDTTDYSIKNTPWKGGKGDVVQMMAESCKRSGIKLGLYLSPADRKHGAPLTWGTDWKGPQGHAKDPKDQSAYDKLFRAQLEELMSRYPDTVELWFDGGIQTEIGDILDRHPRTLVMGAGSRTTVRTAGEDGFAPYPSWSVVNNTWLPVECPAPARDTWYWFWNENTDHMLKSLDHLMEIYYNTVGRNAVMLLSAGPDREGLIPENEMKRYAEFGEEVKRRFGHPIAETSGRGTEIELRVTGAPIGIVAMARVDSTDGNDKLQRVWHGAQTVDHVVLMEDISQGERVQEYVVEGLVNGAWRELSRGSCISHKKIDRFNPVMVTKMRLRVTNALAEPSIRRFAVYNTSWDWWKG